MFTELLVFPALFFFDDGVVLCMHMFMYKVRAHAYEYHFMCADV